MLDFVDQASVFLVANIWTKDTPDFIPGYHQRDPDLHQEPQFFFVLASARLGFGGLTVLLFQFGTDTLLLFPYRATDGLMVEAIQELHRGHGWMDGQARMALPA